jgi:hypothetical protein
MLAMGSVTAQVDEADKLEAVRTFQKFFRKYKEEAQQVEAVMTLKGNECPAAAEELLKLLKHPVAAVQNAALAVIETYRETATFQAWIDALPASKDAEQVATLAKLLGRAKVKAALPALQKVGTDPKAAPTVRFEVARALLLIGDPAAAPTVDLLLADGDPLVRMAAADCVGALKLGGLGPKITALLDDPEWQVQSAAIAAAAAVRPQAAVQPLIDQMRKSGRLRTECADALFRITGFDFGVDPERWQEQWSKLMAIEGWRIPTDEELAKKAESRKRTDEFYGKKSQTNTFAKIPTTSTRVLFIIDVSGSMDDLVVEHEKFQGYRDYKKFTVVKTELLNAIETLTQDTWFDIVAFASDLHPWRKKLVPANIVNRDAAKAWVGNLAPLGGVDQQDLAAAGLGGSANLAAGKTNTLKALLYIFGVDPDNPVKAVFTGGERVSIKNKIDTVYFLSDGRPSIGKLVDTKEILKEVRRYNEVFRIVIHAIAIGEFQKEFLKELAERNGGVFVDLGR